MKLRKRGLGEERGSSGQNLIFNFPINSCFRVYIVSLYSLLMKLHALVAKIRNIIEKVVQGEEIIYNVKI